MAIKNRLLSSGETFDLAIGQSYTLKDDEVLLNFHIYKKSDLELHMENVNPAFTQDKIRVGIRLRDGLRHQPSPQSRFDEWEIDGSTPASLADCYEEIQTAIYQATGGGGGGTGDASEATLQNIGTILTGSERPVDVVEALADGNTDAGVQSLSILFDGDGGTIDGVSVDDGFNVSFSPNKGADTVGAIPFTVPTSGGSRIVISYVR